MLEKPNTVEINKEWRIKYIDSVIDILWWSSLIDIL